uniref:glutathione transferase n=1 Tax=Ditylenchus dipsaci TaxID=166011 RepID=A0A915EBP3_9BILA
MLYGKVPVLEVDGKPLAESFAIFRYLAKQYGLLGKDDWEQAKVDEFSNVHKDIATEIGAYIRVYAGYGQGDKEQLYKDVFLPGMQKYLPLYVKTLKESGSGFVAKSGLTWVDFMLAEFLTTLKNMHPEEIANTLS